MNSVHTHRYVGANENETIAQAHADHPDGFEMMSITRSGYFWWRKTTLVVRAFASTMPKEMRKIRLISAIYAQRERRQQQAAQQDVMSHAHDSKPQQ